MYVTSHTGGRKVKASSLKSRHTLLLPFVYKNESVEICSSWNWNSKDVSHPQQGCICVKWAATHMCCLCCTLCAPPILSQPTHCGTAVPVARGWSLFDASCRSEEAAHRWAPLQNVSPTTTLLQEASANAALQWSHSTRRRRRLQVGRGLISRWIISRQPPTSTTKPASQAIVVCEMKMDQKWIRMLVILLLYQSKFDIKFIHTTLWRALWSFSRLWFEGPRNRLVMYIFWMLSFYYVVFLASASGAGALVIKDGEKVEINCKADEQYSMVVWFRVLDESGMEFIASFTKDGSIKTTPTPLSPNIDHSKMSNNILMLKSFSRARDSGAYSCAIMKSNELKFGKVTRLTGGESCFL